MIFIHFADLSLKNNKNLTEFSKKIIKFAKKSIFLFECIELPLAMAANMPTKYFNEYAINICNERKVKIR